MSLPGWDADNALGLTISCNNIEEDLTDFPVLITLSSGSGQDSYDATCVFDELTTASGSYDNRKKIAVTTTVSGVETELYVEIECWDDTTASGNEQAWLWTKVPTIVSGTDTTLYLYYDSNHTTNSGHVGDTGETPAQNVWDDDFVMVHHNSTDPSSTMTDSTSNGHNLTLYNMDSGNLTDGPIAKTMSFNGTNEHMQTADHADFDIDTYTVEAILNIPSGGSAHTICHHGDATAGGQQGIESVVNSTGEVGIQYFNGSWRFPKSTGTITYNQNAYIVTSVDASYLNVYFDGAPETPVSLPAALTDTTYPMYVGVRKSTTLVQYMTTVVEELRYSKITRSDAWIKATYYSNWDDLITFGEGPPTYYFSGHVYELGNTISGAQLFMYRRDTGAYLGTTTSSGDGGFYVTTSYSGSHFLVCLDPVAGQSYNDLVYGEMYPVTVSG